MRRILPYLLFAALILTVSGCGSSRDTVEREVQETSGGDTGRMVRPMLMAATIGVPQNFNLAGYFKV